MSEENEVKCSFCGSPKSKTKILVAGVNGHICENCIGQAHQIVEDELLEDEAAITFFPGELTLKKPSEIKQYLDEYVIGQEEAKKVLSVAVYNHYKRLKHSHYRGNEVEIEKSNIILIGPTGTGKTLLAKTIAKMLDVPFCIADATVLTEAGYVGEDVESVLSRLLQASGYDVAKAERGIVFIDEIDKISRKGDSASITRDVSGEGVQQALLKLLEGSEVNVPPQGGRKHPEQKLIKINTKNIMFICGGAFADIEKIISRRVNKSPIGFSTNDQVQIDEENILKYVAPSDLKAYGLIPELIGRFPVLSHLSPLDKKSMIRILTEPKNALIKQYEKLFEMDRVGITFTKDALEYIVDHAIEHNIGARGLRSICESIMLDEMFTVPDYEVDEFRDMEITRSYVERKLNHLTKGELKVA